MALGNQHLLWPDAGERMMKQVLHPLEKQRRYLFEESICFQWKQCGRPLY